MSEWRETTLGELCDEGDGDIRTGPFGSQLHEADYSEFGVPVIMPKDIATGRVDESTIARVGLDHVNRLSQHKLSVGDIVYGRRGDIGRKALITEREAGWLCGTGCLRVTVGAGADPRFLFYRLGEPDTVTAIRNRAVGATMPNLNTTILREVALTVPPIETQRRIAGILGAYDDLIEVNRRRVAVLEDMARGLFEEWFVRLRFPGHESVPLHNTPDGPLPEGWRFAPLQELCDKITDGAHHSPPTAEQGRLMASVRDMREWGFDYSGCRVIGEDDWASLERADCRPRIGDILVAKDGANLNKHTFLIWKDEPVVLLSSVAILRPSQGVEKELLTATLRSAGTSAAIKNMRSGAAIPRIILKDFKRLPITWPEQRIRSAFERLIQPIYQECRIIAEANQRLAASRDLLLPRLMSGGLSVAEAQKELEIA